MNRHEVIAPSRWWGDEIKCNKRFYTVKYKQQASFTAAARENEGKSSLDGVKFLISPVLFGLIRSIVPRQQETKKIKEVLCKKTGDLLPAAHESQNSHKFHLKIPQVWAAELCFTVALKPRNKVWSFAEHNCKDWRFFSRVFHSIVRDNKFLI